MITYYTDGSASPNPGPGGFAVIKNGKPYMVGGEPSGDATTNIRMEGLAIKTALEDAAGEECQIFTDSEFWINVITKWAPGWEAKGWVKKGGEIKNLDIVKEVYPLYVASQATLTWVRGHEGDEGNEMADEWANNARIQKARLPEKIDQKPLTLQELVHVHFRSAVTMQLATMHGDQPRVNSVYFAVSEDDTVVYWMSEPGRRHSVDCIENPRTAGAIAVKTDHPVIGLQFTGEALEVFDAEEVKRAAAIYSAKYNGYAADFYDRFVDGTNKHHLYKMTLQSLEIFDEVNYPGGQPIMVI